VKGGLKKELTITITGIVLLSIVLISIVANVFINKEFEKYAKKEQSARSEEIVTHLESQYQPLFQSWNDDYIHGLGMYALYEGYIIRLYDSKHNLVWDAENHDMALMTEVMQAIEARMKSSKPFFEGGFVTKSFPLSYDHTAIGSVEITFYGPYFYTENDLNFLKALNTIFFVVGLIALVGAMLTSRLISQKMIKPILDTVEAAKLISKGQYKVMAEDIPESEELKVLVTTMNQMASSLEQQEKLRKQLTTDVAHELRTPLTTVSSHLEAMIEGVWEPTEDRLRSCYEEIGRITGLVSDLESLSKVEVDNLKLTRTNEDLLEILNAIKYNFEIETRKKQIEFTVTGTSVIASIDKDRIYQVIVNLVSNAIHYTPEGGSIRCNISKTELEAILEISDSGIGISEADLPYIFERFYRTDKSRNRRTGGAGIGLTIAKSIVLAHGGSIEVESESSLGSRFIVRLPLKTI